jgi:purine-binding chemotaxis protein CheW
MARSPTTTPTNIAAGDVRQFVTVTVDKQVFGIPVLTVHEVLAAEKMTPIPLAPRQVAGVLNLRGRIVTAIDVRQALGLPSLPPERKGMYVVVETRGEFYSLVVDKVGEVMDIPQTAFERPPQTLEARWRNVSSGIFRLDGKLLLVLDVERLLDFSRSKAA